MRRKLYVLVLSALIAALCMICLSSCFDENREFKFGDYRYKVENGGVVITGYKGQDTDLAMPASIKDMPVVAIGNGAFLNCDTIKSMTIPDSVVRIEGLAFSKCYALEKVTLGQGIREIDFSPFAFCDKMTYNEYQSGYYVGTEENPYFAFVSTASKSLETLTIHPNTVVVCGSAIENCYTLCEVKIPEGVISLGGFVFQHCSSLEKVHIPKSLESIGLLAFKKCDSLVEFVVADENSHFKSIDGSLFSKDGSRLIKYAAGQTVSSYCVPDGTVVIEESSFENAKHLTEVTLADSVEEIGHSAFLYCENMQSIRFGNALKDIGGAAFGFCASLKEIVLPDSVQEISYSAFYCCDKLEFVEIGRGVVSLEDEVFYSCDALTEVVFRDADGWRVRTMYALFSDKVDLSDSKQNADYLTGEYCEHYWYKE